MTVESFLTRELDIRFIDARNIVNESKVNLGIQGYPTKDQEMDIVKQAYIVFAARSESSKDSMRRLHTNLESYKFPAGSIDSSMGSDPSESGTDGASYCGGSATSSSSSSRSRKSKLLGFSTKGGEHKSVFRLGRRLSRKSN